MDFILGNYKSKIKELMITFYIVILVEFKTILVK